MACCSVLVIVGQVLLLLLAESLSLALMRCFALRFVGEAMGVKEKWMATAALVCGMEAGECSSKIKDNSRTVENKRLESQWKNCGHILNLYFLPVNGEFSS
jgi:hypothetical protein